MITNGQATPEEVVARLLEMVGVEHQEEIMTAGEQLIERGVKKGREEGLREGIKAGREESLLKLLRARFGAISEGHARASTRQGRRPRRLVRPALTAYLRLTRSSSTEEPVFGLAD